jgi:hypothetical protein
LPSATGSNQLSIGNWIYGSAGNISIGTAAVNQQLTVNAGMNIDQANLNGDLPTIALTFGNSNGGIAGEGIASNRSNTLAGTNRYGLDFYTDYANRMSITNTGNVGIGVRAPANKLEVCGTIRATEVLVQAGWCDYVFEKDYKLRPLAAVQQFVDQNKHLPDVPSAPEIEAGGIRVAQMDSIMIKKIEELTLYLVDQNKQLAAQNLQLAEQDKQIGQLRQKLEMLEKQHAGLNKNDK